MTESEQVIANAIARRAHEVRVATMRGLTGKDIPPSDPVAIAKLAITALCQAGFEISRGSDR